MCLMCMWYIESCDKPECVAKATGEELYHSRKTDYKLFIWQGISEPCEHIKAGHGPDCTVFDPEDRDCNCWKQDDVWHYA